MTRSASSKGKGENDWSCGHFEFFKANCIGFNTLPSFQGKTFWRVSCHLHFWMMEPTSDRDTVLSFRCSHGSHGLVYVTSLDFFLLPADIDLDVHIIGMDGGAQLHATWSSRRDDGFALQLAMCPCCPSISCDWRIPPEPKLKLWPSILSSNHGAFDPQLQS